MIYILFEAFQEDAMLQQQPNGITVWDCVPLLLVSFRGVQ